MRLGTDLNDGRSPEDRIWDPPHRVATDGQHQLYCIVLYYTILYSTVQVDSQTTRSPQLPMSIVWGGSCMYCTWGVSCMYCTVLYCTILYSTGQVGCVSEPDLDCWRGHQPETRRARHAQRSQACTGRWTRRWPGRSSWWGARRWAGWWRTSGWWAGWWRTSGGCLLLSGQACCPRLPLP